MIIYLVREEKCEKAETQSATTPLFLVKALNMCFVIVGNKSKAHGITKRFVLGKRQERIFPLPTELGLR